jgi:hypothetical protein
LTAQRFSSLGQRREIVFSSRRMDLSFRSTIRCAAALLLLASACAGAPPLTLTTHMVREGRPPGGHWTIPRAAALGSESRELVMTVSKRGDSGTDVYAGLAFTTSDDGGETWAPLTELPYQPHKLREGVVGMMGATVPVFHPPTGKVLLLGNCVGYTDYGTPTVKLTPLRFPAYAVYDPVVRRWSAEYTVLEGEPDANTTSGVPWVLADGTLLWPCNGGRVLKAAFDGEKLTIVARGPQIEGLGNQPKNTGEYHLTQLGDRFYLAMRCPDQNRLAVSADGLTFERAMDLQWDDGSLVPASATQMRWIRQQDRLYLVYARVNPEGKRVFRNRTPLWMAELDPATLRLKKSTELMAVPSSPAEDDLGNFGTTHVNDELSLITTSEFGRTPESNSRVYVTRVESAQNR